MEIYDLACDRNDKIIKMDDIKASSINTYRLGYLYYGGSIMVVIVW